MTDSPPERVVFDAEPLVAYFCDEPGSDRVEAYVEAVEGATEGYISTVTLAEIHYVVRSIDSREHADLAIEILEESGIRQVETGEVWPLAAEFKFRHAPSLGDAFALGTAAHVDGTLLVGGDDDYDDVTDVQIERFRTDLA